MTSPIQRVEGKAMAKTAEEANNVVAIKEKKLAYLVNCREISNAVQTFFFAKPCKCFFFKIITFFTFLCSNSTRSCAVCVSSLAEPEQGGGVSCFLSVSLSFDLAEHWEMRAEPTQYYTPWTRGHGPFLKEL